MDFGATFIISDMKGRGGCTRGYSNQFRYPLFHQIWKRLHHPRYNVNKAMWKKGKKKNKTKQNKINQQTRPRQEKKNKNKTKEKRKEKREKKRKERKRKKKK